MDERLVLANRSKRGNETLYIDFLSSILTPSYTLDIYLHSLLHPFHPSHLSSLYLIPLSSIPTFAHTPLIHPHHHYFSGKRALHFVEAGKYVAKEETIRMQEERKIIAGYSSGRKAPELITGDGMGDGKDQRAVTEGSSGASAAVDEDGNENEADGSNKDNSMTVTEAHTSSSSSSSSSQAYGPALTLVPMVLPRSEAWGGGSVPTIEWWDEAFLPKELREARKRAAIANKTNLAFSSSKDNKDKDNGGGANNFTATMLMTTEECYAKVSMAHVKTYIYVQHPPSIKALGGEKPAVPLPMYLTKKERKRIRKTAREQRYGEHILLIMPAINPLLIIICEYTLCAHPSLTPAHTCYAL